MKNDPYISSRTRDAALRAIEDLPTKTLLDAMRQLPISDYRRKDVSESYAKDLQEHRKTFRMDEEEGVSRLPKAPQDPASLLSAMSYAKAPSGESAGEVAGPKRMQGADAPQQGAPLGAFKLAKPKLPDSQAPIYSGFKIDGSAGDGTAQTEAG